MSETAPQRESHKPSHTVLVLDDNFLHQLRNAPPQHQSELTTQVSVVSDILNHHHHMRTTAGVLRIEEKKLVEKHKLLHDWHDRMKALVWMHKKSFEFFRVLSLCIMIPTILLSTAAGAMNLTNTSDSCQPGAPKSSSRISGDATSLTLGVLSLTSAGLSTVYHFLHLGERQSLHLTTASQFEKLARQISVQSILTETDERTYVNLSEFIKECSEQYDQLTDMMPNVPAFIVSRLLSKSLADRDREFMFLHI